MGDLPRASAVVLAGGRSRRFGAQKLAVTVGGVPLLHRALRAVALVCEEVLIVGDPSGLPVRLPVDSGAALVTVLDERPFEGPLTALVHAARHASHDRLLLVAGDMPDLQPAILRLLLTFSGKNDGACLVVGDQRQPLPTALARQAVLERGAELVEAGERSLQALIATLDVAAIAEAEWRALDPAARSFRDIDRPEDLDMEPEGHA